MREEQLQALAAVAHAASIAGAAAELGRSSSAVSRQLASLEAEVGVRLLSRGPHGTGLTSAGAASLDQVRDVLEGMSKARAAVQF